MSLLSGFFLIRLKIAKTTVFNIASGHSYLQENEIPVAWIFVPQMLWNKNYASLKSDIDMYIHNMLINADCIWSNAVNVVDYDRSDSDKIQRII